MDHHQKTPVAAGDSRGNRLRSAGRARSRIRRYALANGLNRIVTLTQRCQRCDGAGINRACVCPEGPLRSADRDEAMREARNLIRRLRRRLGRSEPLLFVVEYHRDGVWHLHMLTRLAMPLAWWERVWGLGIVHPGRDASGDAHRAAAYAAKYVQKALEAGYYRHSYEVTRGFTPQPLRTLVESVEDALEALDVAFGWCDPEVVALHEVVDGWPAARTWLVYQSGGGGPS